MANFVDRVKETTATTGTGAVTLSGTPSSGFRTWSGGGAVNATVYPYIIEDGSASEWGWGTYTAAGTTLSRTLVGSTTGSLLNLTGNATVACGLHSGALRFMGAKVKKSADQTAANYTSATAIAWDAEEYDTDGFHDNVTNNTRLTIPSGLPINYVELTCNIRIDAFTADVFHQIIIRKNGDANLVYAAPLSEAGTAAGRSCAVSGPVAVVAGDYFEATLTVETDTSVTIPAHVGCFFALRVVG